MNGLRNSKQSSQQRPRGGDEWGAPIFFRLHVLAQLFRRLQRLQCTRRFGVDLSECELIGIVQSLGRPSCKQICQAGDLDKAQVSRIVKQLADQGLLVRSAHRVRQQTSNVALTERGHALARAVREATLKLNSEPLSAIPAAERAAFAAVMSMLTKKVRLMLHEQRSGADHRRKLPPLRKSRAQRRSSRRATARAVKRRG